MKRNDIRNVAIIAHVDHGKTTLVDALLRQSGMFREASLGNELILDNNDLERERGITILSKNVAVTYKETKINIIDTPGHADFSGEVERVLKMADGCLLVVDSFEGPMPQTRFVLRKAFECKLKPIVVINKIDRPDQRAEEVLNEIFDLFVELDAPSDALDFPVVYGSGRDGWMSEDPANKTTDVRSLFESILQHVPLADVDETAPLQMLVTTLDYSDYVGRIAIGRIVNGIVRSRQKIKLLGRNGKRRDEVVQQLFVFDGLGRKEVEEARAGDICAVVGLKHVDIGDTIADFERPEPLPMIEIDEPTLHMVFRVNDSPMQGLEGKFVTSRQIRDRLEKELEKNVALRVDFSHGETEFHVSGRGLLHLSVLLETMRREGFELSVTKPKVIYKEIGGRKAEPIELLVVDVPQVHMGSVMELVGLRRGECRNVDQRGASAHMQFVIPARGLIGLKSRLMTATQGEAIMHHRFYEYELLKGAIPGRQLGVMVASEAGQVTDYALDGLQDRGVMFVKAGDQVYEGQIVGEHNRENDIVVNVSRAKQLTNMRASGSDKRILLTPPRDISLELALEYVEDDELVEITPESIRLRKRLLKENDRKKQQRKKDAEEAGVG